MNAPSPDYKRIALDFDGTWNDCPNAFDAMIVNAHKDNALIAIVTMRFKNESIDHLFPQNWVIYTGRKGKIDFCKKIGITFDIWIDDNPHFLHQDAYVEASDPKSGRHFNEWDKPEYSSRRTTRNDLSEEVLKILSA